MATKKTKVTAKSKTTKSVKKSTSVKKTKAAGKKTAGKKVVKKKTAAKKKAVAKKAVAVVKKTAPKKKVAAKKVVTKKTAEKKATPKKIVTVKKTTESRSHGEKNVIAKTPIEKPETRNPKPLSRNQLKKSSAKKRSSERETLLDATYSSNPKTPKNTLPVDPKALKLCKAIVNAIEEKKGDNIACLDLRNIENRVCDYFIICDGNSTTQIEAIAGSVEFLVKRDVGERPYRSEGYENKTWILIDYVNVIVHIFDKETRYFYNLESLWADGEKISF